MRIVYTQNCLAGEQSARERRPEPPYSPALGREARMPRVRPPGGPAHLRGCDPNDPIGSSHLTSAVEARDDDRARETLATEAGRHSLTLASPVRPASPLRPAG